MQPISTDVVIFELEELFAIAPITPTTFIEQGIIDKSLPQQIYMWDKAKFEALRVFICSNDIEQLIIAEANYESGKYYWDGENFQRYVIISLRCNENTCCKLENFPGFGSFQTP